MDDKIKEIIERKEFVMDWLRRAKSNLERAKL